MGYPHEDQPVLQTAYFFRTGRNPETKAYMDEKLRAAQWVIRSIEQRNRTIVKVVSSIVKFQEQFFDHGVQYLKPLVLKQVAEDIGIMNRRSVV